MITSGIFGWLTNSHELMALLQQNWLYGITLVATVIFLETGLVILPFLPGDSLLFAVGAFLGISGIFPVPALAILIAAAFFGDLINFKIGSSRVGSTIIKKQWIRPAHLSKARGFFERFGGVVIIMARFIPVVRSVAPFLAGMAGMNPARFLSYNIIGGMLWCILLVMAGYGLGQFVWVQANLTLLAGLIIAISLLPLGVQAYRKRR
ncbi:VTT domain-containing protein [Eoetvoesiella caeni]|uniref:VTT domain-containing protein n=1 Tax=Eoetvoesiella caeni TaxID=645616 RepID=UPI001F5A2064|nr:VTT domain-containing protein [Eoetvoesiella caeni]MCI2810960.1 VTT domain-containing protein [Eoetvoesiella caeni]